MLRVRLWSIGILHLCLSFLLFGLTAFFNPSTVVAGEQTERKLHEYDQLIEQSDREHWSYQPIRKPRIPSVQDAEWSQNPIDDFILAELEKKGWLPSPSVSRRALLRRLYLDVIGFPPELDEQQQFLMDSSPNAVERLVDDLLSRPGYAERWGRHWLDLVRYAETNGYERDAEKPSVWRYRDYVIRSFNDDKKYDRFVLEQLAGDELAETSTETAIATGFYRLGPWDDEPADPKQDRFDQLDDMVRTTSQTFLGLTLGCCRCHDHKFDALTMHDYYRIVAIFNPLSRPRNGRRELDSPAGSRAQLEALELRDNRIGDLTQQMSAIRHAYRMDFLKSGKSELPSKILDAFQTDDQKRTSRQKELVKRHSQQLEKEVAEAIPSATRREILVLENQINQLRQATPDLPRAYFMTETSPTAPKTHLLLRGRAALPGLAVQPGLPTVLAKAQPRFIAADNYTSRRRLTLARWIADADNPLTARVIVNRVWQHHFRRAIVRTPSNFGVLGSPPTHPELLDWLAHWFIHDADWSLKKLHRLILTSRTYRMSSRWNPDDGRRDPENELFWRFPYRRLEVEAIRDSMLAVSGQLNHKMYGPGIYLSVPTEALDGHSDPD